MVKLKKKVRENVINNFKNLLDKFPKEEILRLITETKNRSITYQNIVWYLNSLQYYNFNEITDMELIMLCGKHNYVFTAGITYFTLEQTLAINNLTDAIFEMRHSDKTKSS